MKRSLKILALAMVCAMSHVVAAPVATAADSAVLQASSASIPQSHPLGSEWPNWFNSPMFGDFVDVGGGWSWAPWLGYFFYSVSGAQSWIFSEDLGWCFVLGGSVAASNWWVWIHELDDWGWTHAGDFPNLYLANLGTWVWFDAALRDYYNYTTGTWLSEPGNGGGNGGHHTVDLVLINTGGLPQASWDMATQMYVAQAGAHGNHDVFTEGNELIVRYHLGSAAEADQLRNLLQAAYASDTNPMITIQVR